MDVFLSNLKSSLVPVQDLDKPHLRNTEKKAAIAVILREGSPCLPSGKPRIQILYIRRALRPDDLWSGHIGFPGGNAKKGEKYYDCGAREVREEIGVDLLDKKRFKCLGGLGVRLFGAFALRPILWLKKDSEPLSFKLDLKEVSSVFWLDPEEFETAPKHLIHAGEDRPRLRWPMWWFELYEKLGFYIVTYPSLIVTPIEEYKPLDTVIPGPLVLWGVTLEITYRALSLAGYEPIARLKEFGTVEDPVIVYVREKTAEEINATHKDDPQALKSLGYMQDHIGRRTLLAKL